MAIYTLEEILQNTGAKESDIKTATGTKQSPNPVKNDVFNKIKQNISSQPSSNSDVVSNATKRVAPQATEVPKDPGFFKGIAQDFGKRNDAMVAAQQSDQGIGSKILQTYGQGAGFFGDVVNRGVKAVGDIIPEAVKKPFVAGFKETGTDIASTELGQRGIEAMSNGIEYYNKFKQENPEIAANLESGVNIAMVVPILKGLKEAGIAGNSAFNLAKDAVKTGATAVGDVAKGAITSAGAVATKAGQPIIDATKGVMDTARLAVEGASRIPGRIATNVAEKKAVQETIKALPTKSAQRAVQDGVDIKDAQYFTSIPKEQKASVRKLVESVQKFDAGTSKVDPREMVGKPVGQALDMLKSKQAETGKKLGEIANNLTDTLDEAQTFYPVYDRLKQVNGLEGLKLADDGSLDFTDTVLTTAETASDRAALESIFKEATKKGTGKQKHLLRQELRETLGGKKKGGVQLTSTQEQGYEAVRKGLADVLDTISPDYKKVNMEYAKVSEPLKELSKALKITGEVDDDVINLSAGILARRLTSQSVSNPVIRNLFNKIDSALQTKGKTLTSLETLQDTLNALSRYYDIDPKTGFKAQTTEAVASGVGDFIGSAVKDVAGRTDAVRKKALENMLSELLAD